MKRTSEVLILGVIALLMTAVIAEAGRRPRPFAVEVDTATGSLPDAAFHNTCANGSYAGTTAPFDAKIKTLGKTRFVVSSSWDWSSYDGTNHPAALVSITPRTLEQFGTCVPFDTDATVTITALLAGNPKTSRGEIVAEITGGSVYEVVTAPDARVTAAAQPGGVCPVFGLPLDGTINESIFNFVADPSQPDTPRGSISGDRFSRRAGRIEGTIRTTLNSCTGETQTWVTTFIERP